MVIWVASERLGTKTAFSRTPGGTVPVRRRPFLRMPISIEPAQSDVNRQRPQAFDDEAGELGIFGSSSFVADGEILSGDDRPEGALARARRA
jgi:hypothetical protein